MREYYRQRAEEYEKIYKRNESSRQKEQKEIADVIRRIFQDREILEVACGTGYWTQIASETAQSIIATDIAREMLDVAKNTKQYICPVEFCQADAFNQPFDPKSFNGALANFWFSHLRKNEINKFLENFHSVLQPGSRVFMADNVFNPSVGGELVRKEDDENTYKLRTLEDGSEHLIVKNYPTPKELVGVFSKYSPDFNTQNIHYGSHFWYVDYVSG